MARTTITITVTLEHLSCAACGVLFAFDGDLMQKRRRDHQTFYCPSGHQNYFPGESDLEQLQRALEEARLETKRAEYRAQSATIEHRAAQRQLSATRGQLTKIKKRVANGVCPCCHRAFVQLGRHMATKHPEYAEEDHAT